MIYLDSSALLKLVHEEPESAGLAAWLAAHAGETLVSSELAKVEVIRASRRVDPEAAADARSLVAGLDLVPITGAVLDRACEIGETSLRSLDAIHLASALILAEDLSAFVAYDRRMLAAATTVGLSPTVPR